MIHLIQNFSPFGRMHIVRNKSYKTINKYFFPFVELTFLCICLTLLTFLVEKKLYQATDAHDLLQLTRISTDGNQFGFAQYAFNAIVRPKLWINSRAFSFCRFQFNRQNGNIRTLSPNTTKEIWGLRDFSHIASNCPVMGWEIRLEKKRP